MNTYHNKKQHVLVVLFVIICIFKNSASNLAFDRFFKLHIHMFEMELAKNNFSQAKICLDILYKLYPYHLEYLNERSKELVIKDYEESYLKLRLMDVNDVQWTGSVKTCTPGKISPNAINKTIQMISYFRRQAGLNDNCSSVDSFNIYCQHAALVMEAMENLDHYLNKKHPCYSDLARIAASTSNLSYGNLGPDAVNSQIHDVSSKIVGHRLWLLNPFNTKFGVGITNKVTVIGVFGKFTEWNRDYAKDFYVGKKYVAWPPAGYVVDHVLPLRWSFSLYNGYFEEAKLKMYKLKNGKKELVTTQVTEQNSDNNYAISTITWEGVHGWDIVEETTFEVQITNVYLKNDFEQLDKTKPLSFTYQVKVLDVHKL
ncbi:MAG: hypothetical protein N2167_02030 [Flavobacteriales bacterium]|nr:hypothetical protein [Flavobacteriales bacterium]